MQTPAGRIKHLAALYMARIQGHENKSKVNTEKDQWHRPRRCCGMLEVVLVAGHLTWPDALLCPVNPTVLFFLQSGYDLDDSLSHGIISG